MNAKVREHLLRLGVGVLALLLALSAGCGVIGIMCFYCWVFLKSGWPWYFSYGTITPLILAFAYFIGAAMREACGYD